MSHHNKTYVIFDSENDTWACDRIHRYNGDWHISFEFTDSRDLKAMAGQRQNFQRIQQSLTERIGQCCEFIVLVGENTRYLYRFERWELDIALSLGLAGIVVNLNKKRKVDQDLCPPILRYKNALHIPFERKVIEHALETWPGRFRHSINKCVGEDWTYNKDTFKRLGV